MSFWAQGVTWLPHYRTSPGALEMRFTISTGQTSVLLNIFSCSTNECLCSLEDSPSSWGFEPCVFCTFICSEYLFWAPCFISDYFPLCIYTVTHFHIWRFPLQPTFWSVGHWAAPLVQFEVNRVAQGQLNGGNEVETLSQTSWNSFCKNQDVIAHWTTHTAGSLPTVCFKCINPGLCECILALAYTIKMIIKMYPQNN